MAEQDTVIFLTTVDILLKKKTGELNVSHTQSKELSVVNMTIQHDQLESNGYL